MRAKEHPGFLWVFDDLLDQDAREGLTAAAEQAGLQFAFPGTGMAWVGPPQSCEDLRWRRVRGIR